MRFDELRGDRDRMSVGVTVDSSVERVIQIEFGAGL
jgi:hypothetical protein